MSARLVGAVKLLAMVLLGALVLGATFWVAGLLYLRPAMGQVYDVMPWDWYRHWAAWGEDPTYRPRLLRSIGIASLLPAALIVAVVVTSTGRSNLHGRARFASTSEIARMGLFTGRGIVIGSVGRRILRMPNFLSVLLTAPTGAGKGVGFVVPNLLDWKGSTVTLDTKGENFALTSKHRASEGDAVYVFAPFDEDGQTHRYNPLDYVSDNPLVRSQELQTIAAIFYPPIGKDEMWQDKARELFIGLALYLIETPTLPKTFGEVLRLGGGRGRPLREFVTGLIRDRNFLPVPPGEDPDTWVREPRPAGALDPEGLPRLSDPATNALQAFLGAGNDKTSDSIYTTFSAPLAQWNSPIIDAATSANDFDLRRLRHERMSVYVIITPDVITQASRILNLFFSQMIALNVRDEFSRTRGHRHRVLVMADEFAMPNRMPIFEKGISFIRSYGLTFATVCQSEGQLRAPPPEGYGAEGARTIVANHAARVLYTPTEQRDANEYSEALGTRTVKSHSRQYGPGHAPFVDKGSESDQKRALMLPQEISEMSEDRQIVRIRSKRPIQCDKIAYYEHRRYLAMLRRQSETLRAGPMTEERRDEAIARGELTVAVKRLDIALLQAKNRHQIRAHVVDPDHKLAVDPDTIVTSLPMNALSNPHPTKKEIAECVKAVAAHVTSGTFGTSGWKLARELAAADPESPVAQLMATRAASDDPAALPAANGGTDGAGALGDGAQGADDAGDGGAAPDRSAPDHLVRASELPSEQDLADNPDEPLYDDDVAMIVTDANGVSRTLDADEVEAEFGHEVDGAADDAHPSALVSVDAPPTPIGDAPPSRSGSVPRPAPEMAV